MKLEELRLEAARRGYALVPRGYLLDIAPRERHLQEMRVERDRLHEKIAQLHSALDHEPWWRRLRRP